MTHSNPTAMLAAALAALAAMTPPAGAMVRGTTDTGRNFISGGVGIDEVAALNDERSKYALAVLTAARGSGAFLADIRIRITGVHDALILDTVMDGPWLLVDLPAGRYNIEATYNSRVQKTQLSLGSHGHQQATFYFDTQDEVSPPGTVLPAPEGS
jgi:hypothetical protein